MDIETDSPASDKPFQVPKLNRLQRRVLGTLIEKGCTTPEYYPMTLKALTAGCNQKNNRDPVTNYQEDDAETAIEQLQRFGLTAVVHTSGGRTERYRHLMRQVLSISEAQLAILGELLLRGRQQLGELRSRASRMRPIDTQELLRTELEGLMALGLVGSDADLARRGTMVDHLFYPDEEGMKLTPRVEPFEADEGENRPMTTRSTPTPSAALHQDFQSEIDQLKEENSELRSIVDRLERKVGSIEDELDRLKRELGV